MNSSNRQIRPAAPAKNRLGLRPSAAQNSSRESPPYEDELRSLALGIVQHDPVLAQLLVRAGERARVKIRR